MSESYDYGHRADEMADAMRRYLVGINTGGIAAALTFAASLAERGVQPGWVVWPVVLFASALGVTGFSLLYAKHKALKRKEAADNDREIPRYDAWCQRNFTYELVTLIIFLAAAGLALYRLDNIHFWAVRSASEAIGSDAARRSQVENGTDGAVQQSSETLGEHMEYKYYILAGGVAVTLFLGIWNAISNYRVSKRTTFVNTVTSQRIKWIEQLRQDISSLSGLTYHWCFTDIAGKSEERELIKEIDRLRHVIRLRLNPEAELDKKIEAVIAEIPLHTADQEKIKELLEELTRTTQSLLKEEWEKVKRESKDGPLSERA